MATGIQKHHRPASFHSTRINLEQQPTKATYSTHYFAQSLGTSLFNLAARCWEVAKDTLLMKADDFSKWAYEGLKDISSLHGRTPFEIDYKQDKIFWQAHFCSAIDELSSSQDQTRLKTLQNLVWNGLLSPYQYEEGLKELDWPPALLQAAREQFRTALKNCPIVLEKGLQEDVRIVLSLKANLKEILDYYRPLMNSLDYTENLSALRTSLQQNKKELPFTMRTTREMVAALREALSTTPQDACRDTERARTIFNQIARELPFYFTEINTQGIWADVKEKISENKTSDPLSFSEILLRAGKKGVCYIISHPLQATTAILATQVAATAALNAFAKSKGTSNLGNYVVTQRENSVLNQWILGSEFQINQQHTFVHCANPSAVVLSNGNIFAVWDSTNSTAGNNNEVVGRILFSNGSPVTGEFPISQNTTVNGHQGVPSIVTLTSGNVFIAWSCNSYNPTQPEACGRAIFPNGTAIANAFTIPVGYCFNPFAVALSNDHVLIGYTYYDNQEDMGTIITSEGAVITPEILLHNAPNGNNPSIALLDSEDFFSVWLVSNDETFGQVRALDGTPISDPVPINLNVVGAGLNDGRAASSVVLLNDGNVFVVNRGTSAEDPGSYVVYGRMVDSSGTPSIPSFIINQNIINGAPVNGLTAFNNGNVFVAWVDSTTGNMSGRVLFSNGIAATDEFLISQNAWTLYQENNVLSTIALNNENVFMAWSQGGSINGCIVTNSSITTTGTTGTTATTGTTGPVTTGTTGTTGTTATTGTTGPITTGTTGTTGTTATTGTTSPITTGTPGTTSSSTTGIRTTGTTAHITTATTGTTNSPSANPTSPDDDPPLALILGLAGLGGAIVITTGGVLARKYCLSKRSSQNYKPLLSKLELGAYRSNLFAPSEGGFTTRPTVIGTLNKIGFDLWEQISEKEASALEKILYRKIHFTPDATDQMIFHLGKGQFGETFLASNIASKELVAVKRIRGERQIKESLKEGQIQSRLEKSSDIMPLLDYLHFTPSAEMVGQEPYLFQFMPIAIINGIGYKALTASLATKDPALHQRLLTTHTYQLLKGLNFMHDQWIYHSDVKDANILFMPDCSLKIADFGRALELGKKGVVEGEQALGDRRKFAPEQVSYIRHFWKQEGTDTGPGEVISSYAAGPADLWSGALFILEALSKKEPFNESSASFSTKVTQWTNASFQKVIDQENVLQEASGSNLAGLLKNLLQADPSKRLDASKALKRPVFKTMTPIYEDEGTALLKRLMSTPTTSKTSTSKTLDPYMIEVQKEKDAYYKYR